MPLARAVEPLMVLDAARARRSDRRLARRRARQAGALPRVHEPSGRAHAAADVPESQVGGSPALLPHVFLLIGCHPDGRAPVFLYLVRAWDPFEFRMFLQRHGALLRALAQWRIDRRATRHLEGAEKPHEVACWNEFATPLKPAAAEELRRYFEWRMARPRRCRTPTKSGSVEPTSCSQSHAIGRALQTVERAR